MNESTLTHTDFRSGAVALKRPGKGRSVSMTDSLRGEAARARVVLAGHLLLAAVLIVLVGFRIAFPTSALRSADDRSLILLLCAAWSFATWIYVRRTLFDPYALFILFAFLFHGGYSVLRLFEAQDSIYLLPDLSRETLSAALLVVIVGFVSLHFGALLAVSTRPANVLASTEADDQIPALLFLGVLMTLGALPATILGMRDGIDAVSSGGYKALFLVDAGDGPLRVLRNLSADFLLTGTFFLMVAGRKHRPALVASILLVGLVSGYNLYVGHRAYAVLPVVAAVWLFHRSVRRLPLGLISTVGTVGALYALPIVRQVRELVGVDRFVSAPTDFVTTLPNAVGNVLSEAGGTLMTVGYTIDLVPAARSFELGATYIGAIVNAIPMFSWSRPYGFASDWLAWTIKPEWARGGFGFGYSFLAEAYLNFAWIGVIAVCLLIGFLAVAMLRWAGNDGARLATVAVFLPAFLFFVRGESVDLVRPLLWRAVLPYAVLWFCLRFKARRTSRLSPPPSSRVGSQPLEVDR